jgi:ABC-type branched-subunit amino acid transport system substrate-binding protein
MLTCVAVGGLVALAACTGGSAGSSATSPPASTVKPPRGNVDGQLNLGVLLPVTGPGAGIGASMNQAIAMAVAEINGAGGVLGKPVTVAAADEGADAAAAAAALRKLLDDEHVDAVIGPLSSRIALGVADTAAGAGAVLCSPGASATVTSRLPSDGFLVRTMPSDALQAVALGQAISRTGLRTTAIIAPDDDYGHTFAANLRQELVRQANTVTSVTNYDPTGSDFTAVVAAAGRANPEAIAVIGLPDPGGKIIADLSALGLKPPGTAIFVSDGMRTASLFDVVQPGHPESVAGLQGAAPAVQPAPGSWFDAAFQSFAPGVANLYGAYAYDCANLIALASQVAGTDDAKTFKDYIAPNTRSGVTCRNFPDCQHLLTNGRRIDLNGASGSMELLDNGDRRTGWYDIFQFGPDGKDQATRQTEAALP